MSFRFGRSPVAVLALLAAAVFAVPSPAAADSQPLRIVVPFPPGGAADAFARLVAAKLPEVKPGLTVVVDNKPGAGGVIGSDTVARAPADGNTLLMVTVGHAVNPSIMAKLPYDTRADFVPVALVATVPSLVVVPAESPYKTLADLLKAAKAKPEALEYASSGIGSTGHVSAALIESLAGVEMVHVPYKGAAAALQDVIGARVAMAVDIITSSLPMVKSGKLKALASTGTTRTPAAPDVPTMAEAGLPGYDYTSWYMLLAPGKTTAATVSALNADLRKVSALPDFQARLRETGADSANLDAAAAATYLDGELSKWSKITKERGIKAE